MIDDGLDFLLDTMDVWSFSRLNSFDNCKNEWRMRYLDCNHGESSAFAEYGTLMHSILQQYAEGKLDVWDLVDYYDEHFNEEIIHEFPPNKYVDLRRQYYDKGIEYLENIDLILDKYDILGVEKKVEFQIAGKDFVGYIDLLLQDKTTGEITILDHKSSTIKILKNGNISKTDEHHFRKFIRQLCLYAIAVKAEYGRVDFLEWNMFKDMSHIKIKFNEEDYNEAIQWATDTLLRISQERDFEPTIDSFYCWNLCSQRNNCCLYKP